MNSHVTTQFHVTLAPHVLIHPLNVYVYWFVCSLGVAVLVSPHTVKTFHAILIDVPYGTVMLHVLTVHDAVLLDLTVTV